MTQVLSLAESALSGNNPGWTPLWLSGFFRAARCEMPKIEIGALDGIKMWHS